MPAAATSSCPTPSPLTSRSEHQGQGLWQGLQLQQQHQKQGLQASDPYHTLPMHTVCCSACAYPWRCTLALQGCGRAEQPAQQ